MSNFVDTPLDEVMFLQNDKKAQIRSSEYSESGILPIIDQSSKFICGYTNNTTKKYSKPLPVIVFGDHTLHTKFIDFPFAVGADGTQILKTRDPDHYSKYLYYIIQRQTEIMGSEGYKRHLKILREQVVPFSQKPSEQKKIASILTSVDEVIENTQRQIDKLQELKKATMNELLTKGIGHTEFKDSELGRIPKSWDVVELKDTLSFISYGFTNPMPESDIGNFMVTAKDVTGGKISYETARKTSSEAYTQLLTDKSRPKRGDILLTKDGTLGRLAIVDRDDICINQSVAVLRPNQKATSLFLFCMLSSPAYQNTMMQNAGGSTIKHIYITVVDKMKVAIPEKTEQTKIVLVILSLEKKIEIEEKKLCQTQSLKKSLMQDLLTGKVRVQV